MRKTNNLVEKRKWVAWIHLAHFFTHGCMVWAIAQGPSCQMAHILGSRCGCLCLEMLKTETLDLVLKVQFSGETKYLHAQRSCVAPAFLTVAGCFPRCPSHGALGARKTDGLTVATNGHPVWLCFLLELLVASKKPRCHRTLSYLVSFSCYLRQDRSCCRKMTQK